MRDYGYIAVYIRSTIRYVGNLYPILEDYFYEVRHVEYDENKKPVIYGHKDNRTMESYEKAKKVVNEFKKKYPNYDVHIIGISWLGKEKQYFIEKAEDDLRIAKLLRTGE